MNTCLSLYHYNGGSWPGGDYEIFSIKWEFYPTPVLKYCKYIVFRNEAHLLTVEHKKEQGQRVRELFSWHFFDTCSL